MRIATVSLFRLVSCCAVLGLVVSVSCGKAAEKVTEKATEKAVEKAMEASISKDGGKAKVDIDSKSGAVNIKSVDEKGQTLEMKSSGDGAMTMTQTGPDGTTQMQYGEGAKIPDNFPKDVPVVDGMQIMAATANAADQEYMVQGSTKTAQADVVKFYKEKAPAQGWKQTLDSNAGDFETIMYEKQGDGASRTLSVMVTTDSGNTMVSISVQ